MNTRLVPAVAVAALAAGRRRLRRLRGRLVLQGGSQARGPDQDLVLQQPGGGRLGQGDGQRLERRAPEREGDRPGDPGRQELRGGHRRRDHRRQRAVPGLQHLAGGRAAVPEAGRPGRARRLRRAARRTSRRAPAPRPTSTQSPDGKYYQLPWKSNPVMIFYNKKLFEEGRARPRATRRWAPTTSSWPPPQDRQSSGAPSTRSTRRRRASSSSPGSTSTRCTPPQTGGKQLVENGKATFDYARRASRSPNFWTTIYAEKLAPQGEATTVTRSPTARPRWPSSGRGRSRSTGQGRLGRRAGADRGRQPADQIHTFSDAKNDRDVRLLQEPRHGVGRPEVRHQQGAGRQAADRDRPDADAHGPAGDLRRLLRAEPGVQGVRRRRPPARSRCPNVPNSIEIWQTFRDA